MENSEFKAYLNLLREAAKLIGELRDLERRKLQEVRSNNVQGVDDCIRQEQVLSLSLRGLEQKRVKLQQRLGLDGVRLSGLAGRAPDALRQETMEVVEELRQRYELYNSASSAARSALERVLHQIDQMMAEEVRKTGAQPHAAGKRHVDIPVEEEVIGGHGADFKA